MQLTTSGPDDPNGDVVVPMDVKVRAEVIDLMARILVAVFEAQGGKADDQVLYSPKIKPEHLARRAIVYLRQSSEKQVRQNKESQRLQYDVAERMRAWAGSRWKLSLTISDPAPAWLGATRRIRARPQLGGVRRGGNRRQSGGLTAISYGQGLVPVTGGVPDLRNSHCRRATGL